VTTRRDFRDSTAPRAWLYVAIAGALAIGHQLSGDHDVQGWTYSASIALLPIAALVSWRFLHPPREIWLVSVALAVSFLVANVASSLRGDRSSLALSLAEDISLLLGQVLLVCALIACVHRRRGRLVSTTLADAGIVALTGWMVVYVGLVHPTIERSSDPAFVTLINGLYRCCSMPRPFDRRLCGCSPA
jgi:hypothetical protein